MRATMQPGYWAAEGCQVPRILRHGWIRYETAVPLDIKPKTSTIAMKISYRRFRRKHFVAWRA